MIAACKHSLNSTLLDYFGKQTSIDCLACRVVAFLTVDGLGVDQIHVFLKSLMHEGNAILTIFVLFRDSLGLFSKPFNCVASDAIKAAHAHTVVSSISEHEDA